MTDTTHKRRWRIFLLIEGALLLLSIAGTWVGITYRVDWMKLPITVLWTWLFFTIPIGVLYLLGFVAEPREERPWTWSDLLSPLIPSAEARAFWRELRARPSLMDEEFHTEYYAATEISQDLVDKIRRCLRDFDKIADRLVPSDNLQLLDDELDLAVVLHWAGKACGVEFTRADYPAVEGTLDNLVRLTHAKVQSLRNSRS
jgi:hypothetical protein